MYIKSSLEEDAANKSGATRVDAILEMGVAKKLTSIVLITALVIGGCRRENEN
jgi:hypothetical protein